ncbi:MAG: hypothetical protein LBD03_09900 [Methanobrevibacter sp.]|jgi:hypothetical protein|nr:hypothetical protein [Candidatus Methanovirga procula]
MTILVPSCLKNIVINKKPNIVALACTDPPEGRKRWTIKLIAETLKGKKGFETLSRETVRLVLKKRTLKPLD